MSSDNPVVRGYGGSWAIAAGFVRRRDLIRITRVVLTAGETEILDSKWLPCEAVIRARGESVT